MWYQDIGIFAGATKPPHKGHYRAVQMASETCDEVFVFVSHKERDGITAGMALSIWKMYEKNLPKINIQLTLKSPVTAVYEFVDKLNQQKDAPNTRIHFYCDKDDMERYKRITEYGDKLAEIHFEQTPRLASGTDLRAALAIKDKEKVLSFFPGGVSERKIWTILTQGL